MNWHTLNLNSSLPCEPTGAQSKGRIKRSHLSDIMQQNNHSNMLNIAAWADEDINEAN